MPRIGLKRRCWNCKKIQPLKDFAKSQGEKLRHTYRCLSCMKKYNLGYYKKNTKQFRSYVRSIRGKFVAYKTKAKKYGREFRLTEEQFAALWKESCSYCGDNIKTIGIDRVNSSKGYLPSNVVSCCKVCNTMKSALPKRTFLKHCVKVIEFGDTSCHG